MIPRTGRMFVASYVAVAIASLGFAQDQVAEFSVLPIDDPVNFMEMTEDGKFLVLAHQSENKVSIYDVLQRKVIDEFETPSPRNVLWRGGQIIVGSRNDGSIKVYAKTDKWAAVREMALPKFGLTHISAPCGRAYRNEMLVTTHGDGRQASYQDSVIFAVNSRGQFSPISKAALVTFSFDGTTIIKQESFNLSSNGGITGHNARDYLRSQDDAPKIFTSGDAPYVYQVAKSGYLIGRDKVFGGAPLTEITRDIGKLIIADRAQRLVYGVTREKLSAHKLNVTLSDVGSIEATFPSLFDGPTSRTSTKRVFYGWSHERDYVLDHPEAFTHGDTTHLFIRARDGGVVLAAEIKAFVTPEPSTPSKATKRPGMRPAAEPGDAEPDLRRARLWTSRDGKFQVRALFQAANDSSVKLLRSDNGKVIVLPITALSPDDQAIVKELKGETAGPAPPVAKASGEARIWTAKDGKTKLTAALVEKQGAHVILKRADNGKPVKIAIANLSPEDQAFLRDPGDVARPSVMRPSQTASQPSASQPAASNRTASSPQPTTPSATSPTGNAATAGYPPLLTAVPNPMKPFAGSEQPDDASVPGGIATLADGSKLNEAELIKHCLSYPNASVRADLFGNIGYDDESNVPIETLVQVIRAGMLDPSDEVRKSAIYALQNDKFRQHYVDALPEMVVNLSRRELVTACADGMLSMGDQAAPATPHLAWALNQPECDAADEICMALGAIGAEATDAIGALSRFAAERENVGYAPSAFRALARIGAESEIQKALSGSNAPLRYSAAKAAGDLPRHSPETVKLMMAAASVDEVITRAAATESLGFVRPATEEIVRKLVAALGDRQEAVRSAAAMGLGEAEPKFEFARDALRKAVDSDDDTLAMNAEDALDTYAEMGKPMSFEAIVDKTLKQQEFDSPVGAYIAQMDLLVKTITDDGADEMHRAIALMAFIRAEQNNQIDPGRGKPVEDMLPVLLSKATPLNVRLALATAFGDQQPPFQPEDDERALLLAGIDGGRLKSLRQHAIYRCGELGITEAVPKLLSMIDSKEAKQDVATVHALSALRKMPEASARASGVLMRDYPSFMTDLRSDVLETIAAVTDRPTDAIKFFAKAIESEKGSFRSAKALAMMVTLLTKNKMSLDPALAAIEKGLKSQSLRADSLSAALGESFPAIVEAANANANPDFKTLAKRLSPGGVAPPSAPMSNQAAAKDLAVSPADVEVRQVKDDVVALAPFCQIEAWFPWRVASREPPVFIASGSGEAVMMQVVSKVTTQDDMRSVVFKTFDDQVKKLKDSGCQDIRGTQLDPKMNVRAGVQFQIEAQEPSGDHIYIVIRIKFDDPKYIYVFTATARSEKVALGIVKMSDTFRQMP